MIRYLGVLTGTLSGAANSCDEDYSWLQRGAFGVAVSIDFATLAVQLPPPLYRYMIVCT